MREVNPSFLYHGTPDIVLVAAAGRSGQTWLCFMLSHLLNAKFIEPYCLLRGIVYTGHPYVLGLTQGALPGREATRYNLVVKTHQMPDPYYSLTKKVVIIVRDPRDMITSACLRYHVMKTTGSDVEEDAQGMSLCDDMLPKHATLKERITSLVYGNRMLAITLSARSWRNFHGAWRRLPFGHIVRYEDLLDKSIESMSEICRYLEIPIDESQIGETLHRLSFKEITGRSSGQENAKSIMFRKAAVGDYKKKLNRIELAIIRHFCRKEAARFGYIL
jgi:hypothetical protein